jgi:small-conductance mechanosensitive channel
MLTGLARKMVAGRERQGAPSVPLLKGFADGIYRAPGSWAVAAAKAFVTVAVAVAALLVLSVAEDWVGQPCTPEEEADPAKCRRRRRAATLSSASLTFGRALVVLAGIVVLLHHAGLRTTTLFTLGSILSLVIGLAAQSMLRDLFSGLMFLTEGQLINGDYVQLLTSGASSASLGAGPGLIGGIVENVNLRRVKLRNFDNELVYVPNAEVRAVVNASQQFPVVRLRLQLSRTSDAAAALAAAQAACAALAADPAFRASYPPGRQEAAGAAGSAGEASSSPAAMRLLRSLDAVGMTSPDPELQGVSEVGAGGFEVLVRFMCDVGKQWSAGRYARRALLQALAPFGPVVQAVRVEGA